MISTLALYECYIWYTNDVIGDRGNRGLAPVFAIASLTYLLPSTLAALAVVVGTSAWSPGPQRHSRVVSSGSFSPEIYNSGIEVTTELVYSTGARADRLALRCRIMWSTQRHRNLKLELNAGTHSPLKRSEWHVLTRDHTVLPATHTFYRRMA